MQKIYIIFCISGFIIGFINLIIFFETDFIDYQRKTCIKFLILSILSIAMSLFNLQLATYPNFNRIEVFGIELITLLDIFKIIIVFNIVTIIHNIYGIIVSNR